MNAADALELARARAALKTAKEAASLADARRQAAEEDLSRARTALEGLAIDRNTWARQLADVTDERDASHRETEKALEMLGVVSGDRDRLCHAVGELAEHWETLMKNYERPPTLHAQELRAAIEKWENEQ